MQLDPVFTKKLQDYLNTPIGERDTMAGAMMLFQLNRNRALYNTIIRRPEKFADKLDYELRKFLRMRIDQVAVADVANMQAKVMPKAKETLQTQPVLSVEDELPEAKVAKGRRPDHDSLPDNIKQLWDNNFSLYKRIDMLYNECCAMQDAKALPCDIYEKLKILDEADKKYRNNLAMYDAFDASQVSDAGAEAPATETTASLDPNDIAKRLSASRKTLSKYRQRYAKADTGKKAEIIAKIQECVTTILQFKGEFAADTVKELTAIGIQFK